MRGATSSVMAKYISSIYFNPHSPCGERLLCFLCFPLHIPISIHTPHAGSDEADRFYFYRRDISIHTPHAGSDKIAGPYPAKRKRFQSTLPMRGATCSISPVTPHSFHFNPHSPCGERPASINFNFMDACRFQSTLPMRGATCISCTLLDISLFQSTLPMRGATVDGSQQQYVGHLFQSTLPMRGATFRFYFRLSATTISIHTPHAGSDGTPPPVCRFRFRFQSTLPMRGATIYFHQTVFPIFISIHTPHAGSDLAFLQAQNIFCHFNPHSPCGERR